MSSRITYEDKQAIQNDESIDRKNKVTDSDMNEIKEVVNSHASDIENRVEKEDGKGLSTNDFTNEYEQKLAGIEDNANNYTHPAKHSASMITPDTTHRFVTDDEKQVWNAKASTDVATTEKNGLMSKEDKQDITNIKAEQQTQNTDIENLQNDKADKTELEQKYNELQQENKYLKELNNSLQETVLDSETEASESLVVNTVEGIGKINIFGGERQEKREGYNLFNIDTVTNQKINSQTGNIANVASWKLSDYIKVKALTDYSLSWKSSSAFFQAEFAFFDENKQLLQNGIAIAENGMYSKIITTVENTAFIRITYSVVVNSNAVTREEIMFVEGTEEKLYEPYGVMPSLEYPSEIEAVENSVEINTFNKNRLKSYTVTKSLAQYADVLRGHFILEKDKKYTLSFDTNNNGGALYVNEKYFSNWASCNTDGTRKSLVVTAKVDVNIKNGILLKNNKVVTEPYQLSNITLEEGETSGEYIEHEGETLVMPIQQKMLENDCFVKINGINYEKHNWIELTLDAKTLNKFMQQSTNDSEKYRYFTTLQDLVKQTDIQHEKGYCAHFPMTINAGTHMCHRGFTVSFGANNSNLFIYDEGETLEEFKAKIANEEVKFYLQLQEPILIKCTEEQNKILDKINTYKDCTIITTDNDLCKVSLRYKKDLEKELSDIKQAIIAQGGVN